MILNNIPLVLLAGGLGSRISEETYNKPKPMIKIGKIPIILHLLKYYNYFGIKNFIILAGYKSEVIKSFFLGFKHRKINNFKNDKSVSIQIIDNKNLKDCTITILYTGNKTNTGGRIKKAEKYLKKMNTKNFFLNYSDGLSNINITKLYNFFKRKNKILCISAVLPPGRFGCLNIDKKNEVKKFVEKPKGDNSYISGGFFVCSIKIFKYFKKKNTIFENEELPKIVKKNEAVAYKHNNFWLPVDTMRDLKKMNHLWKSKKPPWKVWK